MRHESHTIKMENNFITPKASSSTSTTKLDSTKEDVVRAAVTSAQENKNRTHVRRRIQLACTRCRRRKIKCSGESPDGAACINCKAANNPECYFLRPETQVVPLHGSILACNYPIMNPLSSLAGSDSFFDKMHSQQTSSGFSPSMYNPSYPRTQSLSDLGNCNRVQSPHRESAYTGGFIDDMYNVPYNLQNPSCMLPTTTATQNFHDCYSSLGNSRAWESTPAATMAPDLTRAQSAVFFASDVPSLFPMANQLSHSDTSAYRVLPVPTSSGLPSVNGYSASSYFRDVETTTSGPSFVTSEDSKNFHHTGSKNLSCTGLKANPTIESFPGIFDSSNLMSQDEKPEILSSHQDSMMRYTVNTDDSLDALPITPSAFTEPGTASSSDAEEPLTMTMNGFKNSPSPNYDNKDNEPFVHEYKPMVNHHLHHHHQRCVTQADPESYSGGTLLHSSTGGHPLSLGYQEY